MDQLWHLVRKPGVKEAADANYREWVEKRKKQNKKRKERPVSYDKLSNKDKAKMQESVLASLCVSSINDEALMITADSSHCSPPAKKPHMTILVVDIAVLSSASPLKSILPAPIVTNFPHIHLQMGSTLDDPACPVIRCVVDTAAAFTTGNFHFVAAIAKRYPHTVAKIFVPEDYNPIVLSGIVQRGGKSITTKLTVGFQFHLPYLMTDGSQTSILIATGPHAPMSRLIQSWVCRSSKPPEPSSTCLTTSRIFVQLITPPSPSNTAAQWCMYLQSRRVPIAQFI
jgi:hypothetical protein